MNFTSALASVPAGLRDPLIQEYRLIIQNFSEARWSPASLSGGRFCEVVYNILDGYGAGTYASTPSKPSDMVSACRKLEQNKSVPRSFQILIPRMLPALYEVRNNRNIGHVGGDVNPNHMDTTLVVSMCSWILAEIIRVFHGLDTSSAQAIVDKLAEIKIPLVWQGPEVTRILDNSLSIPDKILILSAASSEPPTLDSLINSIEYGNRAHFNKTLIQLHNKRHVEFSTKSQTVTILPPGTKRVAEILAKLGT
jgi:hypothetical protein